MKKLFAILLLFASCAKQETVVNETRQQAIERAVASPEITDFYRLTFEEAQLVKLHQLATVQDKVKDIMRRQEALMKVIKQKFPEFTQDEMKVIFKRIADKTQLKFTRPLAARSAARYPYDTNCQANWDDANNTCWSVFLWSQWWHLLKGVVTWGGTVDSVERFTECSTGAQSDYYTCSGD